MASLTVAVIIPSYSARQTIGLCLHALEPQRQHADFDVEAIVVDSSADGTAAVTRPHSPKACDPTL